MKLKVYLCGMIMRFLSIITRECCILLYMLIMHQCLINDLFFIIDHNYLYP